MGFELGPGRAHKAFEKPLAKYLDRAQWWGNTGCGLFLTTVAYTTYIASVLSFLVQLDDLPPSWDEKEREAFSRLVPGFSQWTSSDDLRRLRLLGFPRDFTDMRTRQFAAKVRVAHLEAAGSGGLDVRRRAAALKDLRQKSDEVVLCAAWRDWLDRSFLLQLDNAVREAAARGITRDSVERRILGEAAARPISPQQAGQIKRRFQAMVATMLQQNQPVCIESRIRHKLSRWRVAEFPRVRVERCMHFLQTLGPRVPPRVWAAAWRALWNGWPTNRRTQGREGLPGCLFACSDDAADSIEHYASCRALHPVAESELGLNWQPTPEARLADFLGLSHRRGDNPREAVLRALRLAAVYKVHCLCRHGGTSRGPAALEAIRQAFRELVRGHPRAAQFYDAVHMR